MNIAEKRKTILTEIQEVVQQGNYVLRPHVVNHMISESFKEAHLIEAIQNGKILELYHEENRCLITGTFQISESHKESLHVVVDYWSEVDKMDWVDLVTAYIPRHPFWETPHKRGKIK